LSLKDGIFLEPAATGAEVTKAHGLYQALLRIGRANLREATQEGMCLEVCRALVESGGFLLAWIGWHDPERQIIAPAVKWGDDHHYLQGLQIHTDERSEAYDPAGLAFRARQPYISNNLLLHLSHGGPRPQAERAGIGAAAAFPINSRKVPRGVLTIYAREIGYFGAAEVALLQDAVLDLSYSLNARRRGEERKRGEEMANRVAAIVESANDAIISNSMDGLITSWNPAAAHMFGYSVSEAIGEKITMLMPRERVMKQPEILARLARGNRITDYETVRIRKDGSHFASSIAVSPIRSPDGTVLGASEVVRNIEVRKQSERALSEVRSQVEADLAFARDRAQSANRVKSAFLATMSHELRTPLNTILGFTGIVLRGMAGPLNAEQTKQLAMVQGSARHLLSLINDVLDISKIESGQLEIRAAQFDVRVSLDKVLAIVTPAAEKKSLSISVVAPPRWKNVISDQRRVEQVLLNLLDNAVKFTEHGEIEVTVQFLDVSKEARSISRQPSVSFRIRDTGIGIKESDLGTLFEPFRQLDSRIARQHDGTGLGLAICRGLVDMLGGEINAVSRLGSGSTFTFTIPRVWT
jgi:PAS domain S-box-containing protein